MTAEVTTIPKPQASTVVQRWFPIAAWLPKYQRHTTHRDLDPSHDFRAFGAGLIGFTTRYDVPIFLARLHQHAPPGEKP